MRGAGPNAAGVSPCRATRYRAGGAVPRGHHRRLAPGDHLLRWRLRLGRTFRSCIRPSARTRAGEAAAPRRRAASGEHCSGRVLAEDVATGGSGATLEPFTAELSFDPEEWAAPILQGFVLAADTSEASIAIPGFAANVVVLGP